MCKPRVAVIVVNYVDYNSTEKCVESLLELDVNLQIVVVDNKSPNDSYRILKEKFEKTDVIVVESLMNGGYSYGNNFGIKEALKHNDCLEYIAIMNPDVVIEDSRIFKEMIDDFAKHSQYEAIIPVMIENGEKLIERSGWILPTLKQRIFARTFLEDKRKPQITTNGFYKIVDAVHGSFFIVKRSFLDNNSLFDENVFLYGEESILGIKIKNIGHHAVVDTRFVYYHNHKYAEESEEKTIKNGKIMYKSLKYLTFNYYKINIFQKILFVIVQKSLYYVWFPLKLLIKRSMRMLLLKS